MLFGTNIVLCWNFFCDTSPPVFCQGAFLIGSFFTIKCKILGAHVFFSITDEYSETNFVLNVRSNSYAFRKGFCSESVIFLKINTSTRKFTTLFWCRLYLFFFFFHILFSSPLSYFAPPYIGRYLSPPPPREERLLFP